nr:molybdopterin cofactor-binding domain-containing protein [Methyloceanibacter marginalis]
MCAPFVDYVYDGLDLDQLPKALQPSVVITAADLARDSIGIAEEDYPEGEYLVATGKPPTYLGQAVAILLYDELTAYNGAKEQIVSDGKVIRRGKAVTPPDPVSYEPETSIVHAVTRESGDQHFAQTLHGPVHPSQPGAKNKKAMQLVDKIGERLQSPDLDVFHQTYETPVIDPMFMEPETGLAWFDRKAKTLRLLIGTQSPGYDVTSARALFAPKACPIEIDDVHLYAAYPGGGFGGRDTSILCLYLALAAAYSDTPIRISNDRFQQFQAGIKRHAQRSSLPSASATKISSKRSAIIQFSTAVAAAMSASTSATSPASAEPACTGRLSPMSGRARCIRLRKWRARCAASARFSRRLRLNPWSMRSLSRAGSTLWSFVSSIFCIPGIRSSPRAADSAWPWEHLRQGVGPSAMDKPRRRSEAAIHRG